VVDRGRQGQPQFLLNRGIGDARRPMSRGHDVAALFIALFIEVPQDLVPRHLATPALSVATFVIGCVRHDPKEPRLEGALSPEAVDVPDRRPQCILYDLFRVLPIARDPRGEAIGPVPIRGYKTLGRRRLTLAESLQQFIVAIEPSHVDIRPVG